MTRESFGALSFPAEGDSTGSFLLSDFRLRLQPIVYFMPLSSALLVQCVGAKANLLVKVECGCGHDPSSGVHFSKKMGIRTFRIGAHYSRRLEYGTILCQTFMCDTLVCHEEPF